MSRVFVARQLPGPALDRLAAAHDVDIWAERLPPPAATLRERCGRAEGVLSLLTDRIDAAFIDACPKLAAISNYAVGYDNIDVEAATRRGIRIGNTPDVLTDATADLAFTLLLAAARKIPEAVASVDDGDWLNRKKCGPFYCNCAGIEPSTCTRPAILIVGRASALRSAVPGPFPDFPGCRLGGARRFDCRTES